MSHAVLHCTVSRWHCTAPLLLCTSVRVQETCIRRACVYKHVGVTKREGGMRRGRRGEDQRNGTAKGREAGRGGGWEAGRGVEGGREGGRDGRRKHPYVLAHTANKHACALTGYLVDPFASCMFLLREKASTRSMLKRRGRSYTKMRRRR